MAREGGATQRGVRGRLAVETVFGSPSSLLPFSFLFSSLFLSSSPFSLILAAPVFLASYTSAQAYALGVSAAPYEKTSLPPNCLLATRPTRSRQASTSPQAVFDILAEDRRNLCASSSGARRAE